ncbi:MAG: ATP-binding cassette domain-containing protein [bacterium]|nr:ATP-binding cassette domain-containing protein [bacterium]
MTTNHATLPAVGEPLLTLRGVSKAYGTKQAVAGVDLAIPRGSIYGFLGPNGAGKTTTIRSIMNIILPDSGEILLAGEPLGATARDRIGYLPEERGLYRKMKCVEQLAYLAELKGVPRREAMERADVWLERLGLTENRDKKVDTLSKGMQQKIQFAATFISGPDLVILDEVFSGLDPLNIELLREMILEEKEKGTTILFSTHMLAEAEKICDAICLIEGGEVILDGTLQQVRERFPVHTVRAAWRDETEPPTDLPGVTRREKSEGVWELALAEGVVPDSLLELLAAAGPLTLFSANRPSLGEIFLAAVARHRGEVAA